MTYNEVLSRDIPVLHPDLASRSSARIRPSKDGHWRAFLRIPKRLQYAANGNYYARTKGDGKVIWRSWTPPLAAPPALRPRGSASVVCHSLARASGGCGIPANPDLIRPLSVRVRDVAVRRGPCCGWSKAHRRVSSAHAVRDWGRLVWNRSGLRCVAPAGFGIVIRHAAPPGPGRPPGNTSAPPR
jgi:hypothetical protein